jgi:hypothetical protein
MGGEVLRYFVSPRVQLIFLSLLCSFRVCIGVVHRRHVMSLCPLGCNRYVPLFWLYFLKGIEVEAYGRWWRFARR